MIHVWVTSKVLLSFFVLLVWVQIDPLKNMHITLENQQPLRVRSLTYKGSLATKNCLRCRKCTSVWILTLCECYLYSESITLGKIRAKSVCYKDIFCLTCLTNLNSSQPVSDKKQISYVPLSLSFAAFTDCEDPPKNLWNYKYIPFTTIFIIQITTKYIAN